MFLNICDDVKATRGYTECYMWVFWAWAEILHHLVDGPIAIPLIYGVFIVPNSYQLLIRISQPSTVVLNFPPSQLPGDWTCEGAASVKRLHI